VQFRRIYLDTNTLIKAFEGTESDPLAHSIAGMFGLADPTQEPPFVTSHITLAEILIHPFRFGDLQAQHRYKLLLSSSSHWLEVRTISLPVLVLAARLRATSPLKLPDAIHMATAILAGCSHILTGDTDFRLGDKNAGPDNPEPLSLTDQSIDNLIAWLRK
jgi:predicted nucleic acid-binding protein